ncbi:MAG: SPFH domain-containing protein [Gemmataceae bacterium]|nr:SPFH domain-containing protein [Gemmataceae bacterium]MCI0743591.1 SPFH domain-containing protein [Gemmataceae bacterium]
MTRELPIKVSSGWSMLTLVVLLFPAAVAVFVFGCILAEQRMPAIGVPLIIVGAVVFVGAILLSIGFFTLQPNEAGVLLLFGNYKGTVRDSGFFWANPFFTKKKVSLRARNMEGAKLKVNDKRGNPVEIGVVVVWHVHDTAQASFDVDNYEQYVRLQTESALRHVASIYAYDHGEDTEPEITLRSGQEEVLAAMKKELQERVSKAGVVIEEARLTHLAYAAEIAGVMLRRQQAEAVIAARQKIVHGAVSMVKMALDDLARNGVVSLDEERKAAMVSNLLVVLCGENEVHPVVNTGTLYH